MNKKPTKAERRTEAREKARLMREAQQRKAKRQKVIFATVGVVAVIALVAGVTFLIRSADKQNWSTEAPAGVDEKGAILIGQESAPVTIDVWFDFMCPMCGQFEAATGDTLAKLVSDGKAKVKYHPIAILDNQSQGTRFSTRSASAAMCTASADKTKLVPFMQAMFAQQPQEGTQGHTNDQIAEIATKAGVPGGATDCIKKSQHQGFISYATDNATKADAIKGTPTVKVNGQPVASPTPSAVEAAVAAAAGGTPASPAASGAPTPPASAPATTPGG